MNVPTAFLSVGSNINPVENITHAARLLRQQCRLVDSSLFYRTKPWDGRTDADYLNGIWKIETHLPPMDFALNVLKRIENCLGRIRTDDDYQARTIDLDLILYGDLLSDAPGLRLPAPEIFSRPFVSIPLAELAPHYIIPGAGLTSAVIAAEADSSGMEADYALTRVLQTIITKESPHE